jgi:ATP-dependent RNA helicase DeaD
MTNTRNSPFISISPTTFIKKQQLPTIMTSQNSFADLGLKKELLVILKRLKFKNPLEVQTSVIPCAKQGKNIVLTSQTGSGKTLAYSLGFIDKINKKLGIQMIILLPTRELAIQVGKEIKKICDPLNLNTGVIYGGRDIGGDHKTLKKKLHILIGTPGRIVQHVNEKNIKVGDTKLIVYDESDQMFDHGFARECAYMKTRISKNAQIILASATMTDKVKEFIDHIIPDYEIVDLGIRVPKNIVQEKVFCEKLEKNDLIMTLFNKTGFKRALIFCNTKIKSYNIADFFQNKKLNAKSLNSDLDQNQRIQHLNLFKEGKIKILVTTDIAARGLDIKNVDIVINYDVPTRDEFYIHRVGRTGRLDKKGYALTLICPEDIDRFDNIEFDYELKVKEIKKEGI